MTNSLPSRVTVREVGPRDGLQAEKPMPVAMRAGLIDMMSGAELPKIEAVSFVSEKAVPSMAGAAEVWTLCRNRPEIVYSALVPNRRGAEAAVAAGELDSLQAFLAASDGYNTHNVGKTVEESLGDVADVVAVASAADLPVEVSISCSFGDPYEGEVAPARVVEVAKRVADLGAVGVSLADTTGMANPAKVWELVPMVRDAVPDVRLNCHFHDSRGSALANVLAAMEVGVDEFDSAIGGMGGSPFAPGPNGNLATEDLVAMLEGMGVETGVDVMSLFTAARMVENMIGHRLPARAWRADYPEHGWAALPHNPNLPGYWAESEDGAG
ncbi:MAG TPA: hydroxymethylglutaryl-CoA lyase [Actinomycetota bacterium]|nr:hydroxymethylglutaryl-CoA lyase [Actinomycetota bacterium]